MLSNDKILYSKIRFDVIFIDGLHLAQQTDRDIANSLRFVKDDGFVVLHDCNPPTEWHARENHYYHNTPAGEYWNGTTWKAFLKWRFNPSVYSCCIDSDWGVGVLSKERPIGACISEVNRFFEFADFVNNRETYLNLISFDALKNLLV
ncbi:MAG: class I SAM-dependent methyltransferase [Bacteroidetes bacterium]|nr:class I SAM-dependent methyltransferase [Bacteroidota bacterium]